MDDGRQTLMQTRYIENFVPRSVFDSVVSETYRSVADAFLGCIEYGETYAVETKMEQEPWADGFGTKCTYMLHFGEIVRCRDCKHEIDGYCGRPDGDGGYLLFGVEPDGYCKWGERK